MSSDLVSRLQPSRFAFARANRAVFGLWLVMPWHQLPQLSQ